MKNKIINFLFIVQAVLCFYFCILSFQVWNLAQLYYPREKVGSVKNFDELQKQKIIRSDFWFKTLEPEKIYYVQNRWGNHNQIVVFGRFKTEAVDLLNQMVKECKIIAVPGVNIIDYQDYVAVLPEAFRQFLGIARAAKNGNYCFFNRDGKMAEQMISYENDQADHCDILLNPDTRSFVISAQL